MAKKKKIGCPKCGEKENLRVWKSTLSSAGFDDDGVFHVYGLKDSQIDEVSCCNCEYAFPMAMIAEMDINFG